MNPDKSIIILSTPRSGSVFLAELINLYMSRKAGRNRQMVMGIMNIEYTIEIDDNGHISSENNFEFMDKSNTINLERKATKNIPEDVIANGKIKHYVRREKDKRMDIMKQIDNLGNPATHHMHFTQLNDNVRKSLIEQYEGNIIICLRRNTWNQFLSYCLSYVSGVRLYGEESVKEILSGRKLKLDTQDSNFIRKRIKLLRGPSKKDIEENYPGSIVLYNEDFISNPLVELPKLSSKLSDINKYVKEKELENLTKKMDYPCEKEDLFENIDEMRRIFERVK